jgi:predicted DNA-binding protein with PD1-like motif
MIAKALEPGAARSFFVILEEGDEVMESLKSFALEQGIEAARFSGIGALRETTVAFFKAGEDESREILFDEQVQVLSCMGTIGVTDAGPVVHGHLVLSLLSWSFWSSRARCTAVETMPRTCPPWTEDGTAYS